MTFLAFHAKKLIYPPIFPKYLFYLFTQKNIVSPKHLGKL